jgi:hypothetical protein
MYPLTTSCSQDFFSDEVRALLKGGRKTVNRPEYSSPPCKFAQLACALFLSTASPKGARPLSFPDASSSYHTLAYHKVPANEKKREKIGLKREFGHAYMMLVMEMLSGRTRLSRP